jgi:hypothetical protein
VKEKLVLDSRLEETGGEIKIKHGNKPKRMDVAWLHAVVDMMIVRITTPRRKRGPI